MSDIIVCRHRSVSLNNDNICREISKDKIAVCEKTAGIRSWNFSDLNSACSKCVSSGEYFSSTRSGEMKVNDIGTQQMAQQA